MKNTLPIFLLSIGAFLFSAASVHASGSIVQFGDSLTVGMDAAGIGELYQAAGFTPIIPGNGKTGGSACDGAKAGFPCQSISGVVSAIDANRSALQSATAVVVELGTNPGGSSSYTSTLRADMGQMIDNIRSINPNIKIYWVNLVAKVYQDEYSARNKVIVEVARAKKVTVIDWFHKIFPSGDPENIKGDLIDSNSWLVSPNDVHLTASGYKAMAQAIVSSVSNGGSSVGTPPGETNAAGAATAISTCIVTKVGMPNTSPTPPEFCQQTTGGGAKSGNALSDVAQAIVDGATANCGGRIALDNYPCIKNKIASSVAIHPERVYNEIETNVTAPNVGPNFQCVGFVNAATAGVFDKSLLKEQNGGVTYAFQLLTAGVTNYNVIYANSGNGVQPGDIVVWPSVDGDYAGHVAIVTGVKDPKRVITIAEANQDFKGSVRNEKNITLGNIQGWLRRK